jgi:hypothetical protein
MILNKGEVKMNNKDLNFLKKEIDKLQIPESRKEINVTSIRWLLRSQPKIKDQVKTLLSQWLREYDKE